MAGYEPLIRPLTLRRNFSWTFVGNVVYAACQWGMLVVLTKLVPPESVGQFALGLAVTAPIILFTDLQLRAVQATDARHSYQFGDYLALRLVTTVLALFIICGVAAGYGGEAALVILIIGLAKAFEAISDVFYGLLQQRERMERIAKSMMIKGPLSLLALAGAVYLTGSVFWGAAGLAVAWAVVLLTYDLRSGAWVLRGASESLRPRWRPGILRELAWLALPLGFVMMLISLSANVPRYFVEGYLGQRELGIFAAMAYIMVAGTTLVGALGQAAIPRLAQYYSSEESVGFRSLLLKTVLVGMALGVAGVLAALVAGREILTLLYRPEYAEYLGAFTWLMVAAAISYVASFLGYAITAARYFRVQMPLFAGSVAITALACLWLVPTAGLTGAALAVVIGSVVQMAGSLGIVAHALRNLDGNKVK